MRRPTLEAVASRNRLTGYRETPRRTGRRPIVAIGDLTRISGAGAMRQLVVREST
jgi:hypothetical protein